MHVYGTIITHPSPLLCSFFCWNVFILPACLSCSASLSSFKSWCSPNFSSFYILENKLHEGTVTVTWTPGEKGTLWHYLMDQPKALPLYAAPHPFLYLTMTGFVFLFFSILPTYFRKFAPGCHVDTSKLTHSILKSWLSFLPRFILGPFPSCMITCGNDTYYHLSSHPLKSSYFSLLSFSMCSLHLCLPKLVAPPHSPSPSCASVPALKTLQFLWSS